MLTGLTLESALERREELIGELFAGVAAGLGAAEAAGLGAAAGLLTLIEVFTPLLFNIELLAGLAGVAGFAERVASPFIIGLLEEVVPRVRVLSACFAASLGLAFAQADMRSALEAPAILSLAGAAGFAAGFAAAGAAAGLTV